MPLILFFQLDAATKPSLRYVDVQGDFGVLVILNYENGTSDLKNVFPNKFFIIIKMNSVFEMGWVGVAQ